MIMKIKSLRNWGALGLILVLALLVQTAQSQDNTTGVIPNTTYIKGQDNGGMRILGAQGQNATHPAIGFFSTCPSVAACDDGGGGNGIFRPLANTMAFSTGSAERMRITSGGAVGIGTTSPQALLDVNAVGGVHSIKTTSVGGNAVLAQATSGGNAIVGIANAGNGGVFSSTSGYGLLVTSGKVGIGNANPLSKLAVSGLPNSAPSGEALAGVLCITVNGNIWIDTTPSTPCQ
ncbi:hypothetical protein HY229_09370 [Candidatus Acetothermia bacterium]|nr:hypothetical protein [Candidatus Acetothermia bacterium]MBI3644292.1 hypothetical protein [Candidatus Acetothermia bacterium]